MAEAPDLHTRPAAGLSDAEKRRYEETLHCNRCGFCTSFCPTYLATGDEGLSPRGRNQALRALYEGRLQDAAGASRSFDTCLQCGICTSVCFAEVPTAKLMGAARGRLAQARGASFFQRFVMRVLLPRPRLMEACLWPFFLLKRLGIPRLLNRLGILGLFSRSLAAAEEMADRLPLRFLRSRLRRAPADAEVIHFVACGTNFLSPEAGVAAAGLLDGAGVRHGRADTVCCGLPGMSTGDLDAARTLARRNIEVLEKHPSAAVLADDSSCGAALKDYPSLFEDDPAWLPRAQALAARVKDLSEWAAEKGVSRTGGARARVTYHDPCKARYAQKLTEPPRRLLKSLPGVEYVELPEADQCCGGGGTAAFLQPELSRAVLDRKAACVLSTGADVVCTSSASCLLQLRFGIKRGGGKTQALHLAEFLGKMVK
jgi:glycolate oxidase iron-sulfur subunit